MNGSIFCRNCGQEDTVSSNFCRKCGNPLKDNIVLNAQPQPQTHSKSALEKQKELPVFVFMKAVKPGATLSFGNYEQGSGEAPEKTPIAWKVLTVKSSKALLLSEMILDARPYNDAREDITWEHCTLRKWLNEEFYNRAFSQTQKNTIAETTVYNHDNLRYGTLGGNDTKDKIFLLSFEEAEKYLPTDHDREAGGTSFAKRNGLFLAKKNHLGNSRWWLRSPGGKQDAAGSVYYSGYIYYISYNVHFENMGVRPALWINI